MKRDKKLFSKRRLTFFAFSLLAMSTWADIRITSFNLDTKDKDAMNHPVLDQYGHLCALIKIKTPFQGLGADALQQREKEEKKAKQTLYIIEPANAEHPDETWLYVSDQTKRLRLTHPLYGNLSEGTDVRFGFYYPTIEIVTGLVYNMKIECDENDNYIKSTSSTALPKIGTVSFETDDDRTTMWWDGGMVHPGQSYRVRQGEHSFKASRFFCKPIKEQYIVKSDQTLRISATPQKTSINILAGIEVGKPSSYSNLAYGARLGVSFLHWGYYASFMTSGAKADGADVDTGTFTHEYKMPYTDAKCHYASWHVGAIYRLWAPLQVYAGLGYAQRDITWSGLDGKRHAYEPDHAGGASWECGLLCNVNKFYVSIGTDNLKGKFGGKMGLGVYLTNKNK